MFYLTMLPKELLTNYILYQLNQNSGLDVPIRMFLKALHEILICSQERDLILVSEKHCLKTKMNHL